MESLQNLQLKDALRHDMGISFRYGFLFPASASSKFSVGFYRDDMKISVTTLLDMDSFFSSQLPVALYRAHNVTIWPSRALVTLVFSTLPLLSFLLQFLS